MAEEVKDVVESRPVVHRAAPFSRETGLTFTGAFLGLLAAGMINRMRRRPAAFEPWWHIVYSAVGGALGNRLAHIYDDTTDALNQQYASYARLPSWMHSQLTPEELQAELRQTKTGELRAKYAELARLEEKAFLERKAAAKAQLH